MEINRENRKKKIHREIMAKNFLKQNKTKKAWIHDTRSTIYAMQNKIKEIHT